MEQLVITEWTPGNEESVSQHGATPDDCDRVIRAIAKDREASIWLDIISSQKEWYGAKRYVAVFGSSLLDPSTNTPTLLIGKHIRICFAIKDVHIPGLFRKKIVRVLSMHPIRRRDPLLRKIPSSRFTPAPPLAELLQP